MHIKNKSIFISSTFRDMQAERDMLSDYVLPRVNEFASKYGRAVEIIDLRWGVDTSSISEEEQSKKVLKTCLDEIERCRPFFIGLIGDRYGWVPPSNEMKTVLEANEVSTEEINMSVTALEIEYGVLASKEPPICLFYFRESPNYEKMTEGARSIYQDNPEGCKKLQELKNKIINKFKPDIKHYIATIKDNELVVNNDWGEMVVDDIINKLKLEWGEPPEIGQDWKTQESDTQETFRESRTEHFAGRTETISNLTQFCLSESQNPQLLMIQGEAGSGKSGLLCKVMQAIEKDCVLLPFSCGLSSRSSLIENMLRYFIHLLCERFNLEDDSDTLTKFQDIKDRFRELLFFACQKTKVVVVVDALDQLYKSDEAKKMLWISGKLPENFRLLCSIIEGQETEAIKQLNGEVQTIPIINNNDIMEMIHGIAKRNHKQISSTVVDYILKKKIPEDKQAAQNPLYLSLIVQNLAMLDRYEINTIQNYIEKGMTQPEALAKFMCQRIEETPGDPEGAYLSILERLEKLIGSEFIRCVCGMIAISRSGLRESDLKGAFNELGLIFNPADFSWLRQMMRGHFSQGDMIQWDFSHQSLRRALKNDRLVELKRINYKLIDHFKKSPDTFIMREILHHTYFVNSTRLAVQIIHDHHENHLNAIAKGLADIYTDHENGGSFLLAIPCASIAINKNRRWRITKVIDACQAQLLGNTLAFRIKLMLEAIHLIENEDDNWSQWRLGITQHTLGDLYNKIGEDLKAGELYQKSLDTRIKIYDKSKTITSLKNLVFAYKHVGKYLNSIYKSVEAQEYFDKSLKAYTQIYENEKTNENLRDLSYSYNDMGGILSVTRQKQKASDYFQKSIDARQKIYNQTQTKEAYRELAISYERFGDNLSTHEQTKEKREYLQKSIDIFQKIHEQSATFQALEDLADIYVTFGLFLSYLRQLQEANIYFQKSLDVRKQIFEQTRTTGSLQNLAESYDYLAGNLQLLGKTNEAGELYINKLEICKQVYHQIGTMYSWERLIGSYQNIYRYLIAIEKYREAESYIMNAIDSCLQKYEQTKNLQALRNLRGFYGGMAKYITFIRQTKKALEFYQKQLSTSEQIFEKSTIDRDTSFLLRAYRDIGHHLILIGQTQSAGIFFQKSLIESLKKYTETNQTNIGYLYHLPKSFESICHFLLTIESIQEALLYYQQYLGFILKRYEEKGESRFVIDFLASYGKMLKHLHDKEDYKNIKSIDQSEAIKELWTLLNTSNKKGEYLYDICFYHEAIKTFLNSIELCNKIYETTRDIETLRVLSVSYKDTGYCHQALGQKQDALLYFQKSFDERNKIYNLSGTLFDLLDLLLSCNRLGDKYFELKQSEDALQYRLKSQDLFEQFVKKDPFIKKLDFYFKDKIDECKMKMRK
ncbi:MAG: DUF4062 domain-containing protein [Candidatus Cloacimonetes bacterium]|nr:DUF4062 domain-containing protein [Candidatus Cloacimonadota bacterium]